MTEHERALFYTGAAIYLDLESDEIDTALARAGLDPTRNTVQECRDAIKRLYPARFEMGKRLKPQNWESN